MEQVDSVKQVQKQKTKSNEIDNSKIEVTIKNPKVVKFFNNNKILTHHYLTVKNNNNK